MEENMLKEVSWQEFVDAGLFWWVNRTLHLFGWALVREYPTDAPPRVYPARCRYRGFPEDVEDDGFKRLSRHIRDNADDMVRDADG